MKELGLRFLQPGDMARWICDGKVVRLLRIMPDGTCKIEGMTMEEVRTYPLRACEVGSVVEP